MSKRMVHIAAIVLAMTPALEAAQNPETIDAWLDYVRRTEQRIEGELHSESDAFFVPDFASPDESAAYRRALRRGQAVVEEMKTHREDGSGIDVPGGSIHHWRGAIFIPDVTLDAVLDAVRHPERDAYQEDVLETRVLERSDDFVRVYLKLTRSRIVTAVYNTEHEASYRRYGPRRASSQTTATRIAELEGAGTDREREKAPGEDRGFLWRLRSYWRYAEVDGGVIVECESLSLSRSIPLLARPFVGPIVDGVARESLERTLEAIDDVMFSR